MDHTPGLTELVPGLVSVVVPTRNRAASLRVTLEALLRQSYRSIEILVVDDASSDDTDEVVRATALRDSRVRSLRHARQAGAAAARNTGAGMAKGEYLLFEDDDCRADEERIARLVSALDGAPEAAYAYCWMRVVENGRQTGVRGLLGPWSIGTPCALIRRASFHAAGGFDAELPRLQDFDLWTRLLHDRAAVEVSGALFETRGDVAGISSSPEKLRTASFHIRSKYRDSLLGRRHLARMHRLLAGRLLVEDMWREGLDHYRRSIRLHPGDVRSWTGLLSGALGCRFYRAVVSVQSRAARKKPWMLGGARHRSDDHITRGREGMARGPEASRGSP